MNRPKATVAAGVVLLVMLLSAASVVRAQARDSFRAAGGDGLEARIEAAKKQAREGAGGTVRGEFFWSAYGFNIRPGVAVDNVPGISGGIATGNVGAYETRNAGILLLHEAETGAIVRVEVYNLDRRREGGDTHAVNWLGHASNDESLRLLEKIVAASGRGEAASQAVLAIALHDDGRVASMLRELVHEALPEDVRTTAIAWLGRTPGQLPFLSDIVRDERKSLVMREQAVASIARSRDASALATLQNLYAAVNSRNVKEKIIRLAAKTEPKESAADFLVSIAETDADYGLREQALATLRKKLRRLSAVSSKQ